MRTPSVGIFFCTLFAAGIGTSAAQAASFTAATIMSTPVIVIEGELEPGDERKFIDVALTRSDALVAFNSPGGQLNAGIEIGRAIRLKGFITAVPSGASCASACALAWLGGRKRLLSTGGRLGFHAVYRKGADGTTVSSSGNALVGAYLNQLGLSSSAIEYLTSAPPDGMAWVSPDQARRLDVEVAVLDIDAAPSALPSSALPSSASRPVKSPASSPPAVVPAVLPPSPGIDWKVQGEWVQAASRSTLPDAIPVAVSVRASNANTSIFQYRNGWYGVVIGPFSPGRGAVALAALLTAGEVPHDSLVTRGEAFAALAWGSPRPRTDEGSVATIDARAVATAARFFDTWSADNRTALAFLQAAYDDQINYFGAVTARGSILQEKERFAARWPQRRYTIVPGSVSTACEGGDTQSCAVEGIVTWDAYSSERGTRSVGSAKFTLSMRALLSAPRIVEERSSILSRGVSRVGNTAPGTGQ